MKKDVYTILPDGIYLIQSLERLGIIMDKFKTSEMGKSLKRVFRGELPIEDSVKLAKDEIAGYFAPMQQRSPEDDRDTGFFGDEVGICPLCGATVKRTKFGYGCSGYKAGCKFGFGSYICNRAVSISNAKMLLEAGHTSLIRGFVSPRTGKSFDAWLILSDGKCVFDFQGPQKEQKNSLS